MGAAEKLDTCLRGHLLDDGNRYVRPGGMVTCRECNREDQRAARVRGRRPCECGRGPVVGKQELSGCRECNAIDGTSPIQRDVIQALRIAGQELTTRDVANETGLSLNTAMVALRILEERGLVTSRLDTVFIAGTTMRSVYGTLAESGMSNHARHWRIVGRRI
jgi:DNA-binding transcriptional ArsR family regulator